MKKITSLLFCLVLMLAAYAQEDMQKVNIGVRLGLGGSTLMLPQMSKASLGTKGYNASQKMQIGGTAGVMADFMLKENWSVQTGVMYSLQRFTQTQSSVYTDTANVNYSLSTDNTYKMHRLRVPVMLTYHTSRANNHLSVSAGLYADCALSGDIAYDASAVLTPQHGSDTKYVIAGNFDPFKNDRKYLYYNIADDSHVGKYNLHDGQILNRFDVGVSVEAGYYISKMYVGVQANFGLLNMANKGYFTTNYVERNFNFNILLGYKIN